MPLASLLTLLQSRRGCEHGSNDKGHHHGDAYRQFKPTGVLSEFCHSQCPYR